MSLVETAPAQQASRKSPYVGLGFYTEEYAQWFFGRDAERRRVIGNLRASRLTLLYAESGVGKSSLLRAGVAARLGQLARERADKQGTPGFISVVLSAWGDEPTEQLITEIEGAIAPFAPAARSSLPREGGLEQAIEAATAATNATLLLILDQFEEYFLYGSRERSEGHFADQLARCVGRTDLRANFLIALREDAYAGLGDRFKGKITNVYGNYLHLERLDRKAAREAIEAPLQLFNSMHEGEQPVSIEPELVEAVLEQVRAGEVGHKHGGVGGVTGRDARSSSTERFETPYLQLVMNRLWDRERECESSSLRLQTLDELGGAEEIVKTHLDDALASLTDQERETAIDVFHYLVTPSGTKVAYAIKDLPEYSKHSPAEVNALIEKLQSGERGILRQVAAPPGSSDGPSVEIFHDVLADAILDWRNRQIPARLEREKRAAEEKKRAAEERARRDRRRSLVLIALLVLVVVLGVGALSFWRSAVAARNTAQSRQLAASAVANLARDPELSTLLALSALHKSHTSQAEEALRKALPLLQLRRTLVPGASVTAASYSRDGRLIATAESDGLVRIWDAASHHQLAVLGHLGLPLNGLALSPDGKLLATAGGGGTARLWSVSTHQQLGAPVAEPRYATLHSVAFSPDGTRLLTASEDGTARIWDATHAGHRQLGLIALPGSEISINDAQFSPDGSQIVTAATDGTAQVWDAPAGQPPRHAYTIAARNEEPLSSASFSPDGRLIVTSGLEGSAYLFEAVSTPQSPPPLAIPLPREHAFGAANRAAFSPDSKLVVIAGSAGAWVFEVPSLKRIGRLAVDSALATNTAEFAPDGRQILTAGADGKTRIWGATRALGAGASSWSEVGPPLVGNGSDGLRPAAFSADGRLFAAAGQGGAVSIWETASGRRVAVIAEPGGASINALAFDPRDPHVLLTASEDGSVVLWDTANGAGSEVDNLYPGPDAVAFTPNGERLLVASGYSAWLYDTRKEQKIGEFDEPSHQPIVEVAFNADGTRFVTAGPRDASIWNVDDRSKPLGEIRGALETARFSPDGTVIVTAGDDGTAREWNLAGFTPMGLPMTQPGYAIARDAEFSPDGSRILTASTDGVARVWDANSQQLLTSLAGHSGRIITASFSPVAGSNLVATSSSDGSVKLWFSLPREQRGATLLPGMSFPDGASFSPDGSEIVTAGSDGVARIWDATDDRELASVGKRGEARLASAAFSADGKLIVTASEDGKARVWNLEGDKQLAELPVSPNTPLDGAAFSPHDNHLVLTASRNGEATVWNGTIKEGVIGESGEHRAALTSASFSPDGQQILTTSSDGTAQIWSEWKARHNPRQDAVLSEPGSDNLNDGVFSADGKLVVTASNDGTARVWDASTGAQEAVLSEPGASPVESVAFSPDGSEVLTGSVDGTARIWAWKSKRILTEYPVGDRVLDASFAPHGNEVVTASRAGAQVWSTELAAPIEALERIAKQRVTRSLTAAERASFGLG